MTTTREAALEAALNKIIEMNVQYCVDRYGDAAKAEEMGCVSTARAALSTPATEPQGYVEGLEAALRLIGKDTEYAPDEGVVPSNVAKIANRALAARPDQPAADTRVVTVAQLEQWALGLHGVAYDEIRAIIGNATPDAEYGHHLYEDKTFGYQKGKP